MSEAQVAPASLGDNQPLRLLAAPRIDVADTQLDQLRRIRWSNTPFFDAKPLNFRSKYTFLRPSLSSVGLLYIRGLRA